MKEGNPFQHKSPRRFDASRIGSPMFKAIISIFLQYIESFVTSYVYQLFFFHFGKNPRFYQCSSSYSHPLYGCARVERSLIIVERKDISVSKYRYGLCCLRTLFYIIPICEFRVPLFARSSVNLFNMQSLSIKFAYNLKLDY